MIFKTRALGIPCLCEIVHYSPAMPMQVYRTGNATPPEPEEVELQLLDRHGYKADWLERKLTPADWAKLEQEALGQMEDHANDQ